MKTGRGARPLHVVRGCVLEGHVGRECLARDPQLEKSRVLAASRTSTRRGTRRTEAFVAKCGDPVPVGLLGAQSLQRSKGSASATGLDDARPLPTNRSAGRVAAKASQSAAPSAVSPRRMSPPDAKTRPSGSRNDPPSGTAPLLVAGLVAPKAEEPLGAAPVDLRHHHDAGDSGDESLQEQAARSGIQVSNEVNHFGSHPFRFATKEARSVQNEVAGWCIGTLQHK